MKYFKVITKSFIKFFINIIVFIVSLFIPKSEKIWIFGSWFGNRFSDNSRYLYLYCHENKKKLGLDKVIWITESDDIFKELSSKNFEVIKKNTLKSYWYHLRAKIHLIDQSPDNIDKFFSIRSKRIQLWHGVGFKNIALINEIPNYKSYKYKIIKFIKKITSSGCWYSYIFLSTSEFATKNIFNLSFRLWENKFIESSYPRNLYLENILNTNQLGYIDNNQKYIIEKIQNQINQGKKIVGYFPTYRNDAKINKSKEYIYPFDIKNKEQFEEFDCYLNKNNIFVISKFHFAGDLSYIKKTNNYINLPIELDIYPILKYIDIMITDYSSIYADFLFVNRPIIFYPYDLETYKNQDKGFLFNYEDVTPGEKVFDLESLKKAILDNIEDDKFELERKKIKELYFGKKNNDTFDLLIKKIKEI